MTGDFSQSLEIGYNYEIVRFRRGCYSDCAYCNLHGGSAMVRVYFPMLLLLMALPACTALEQAQAPVAPSAQVASTSSKETLLDCAYKGSVKEAWSCASKTNTTP